MAGHYHSNDASLTQNQGNHIGDRPCVRQSRIYREHNGGNAMKNLMGQDNLAWDTTQAQGAYQGQQVHGPSSQNPSAGAQAAPAAGMAPPAPYAQGPPPPQQQQQQQQYVSQTPWAQDPVPQQAQQQYTAPPAPWAQQQQPPQQAQPPAPYAQAPPQQQQQYAQPPPPQQQQQQQQQPPQHSATHQGRPGAAQANRTTYNFMTGQ